MDINNIIKISINENENIFSVLKRMLDTKTEKNSDVECVYKTGILSTIGCNNLSDMYVANSSAMFLELENEKKAYLATDVMQNVINNFKSRGKRYDGSEENPEAIAADIRQKESEFQQKLNELNSIDFNNSSNVFNWLNSIIDYVNNRDLNLPLGINNIEYGTMANLIVRKLEEKGYTNVPDNVVVNNMDDYFRKLIAYQLDDLSKYEFFAYNYAENLVANNIITEEKIAQIQDNKMLTFNEGIGSYKVDYKVFKNAFNSALASNSPWVDFTAFNIESDQYEKYSVRTNEATNFEERLLNTKIDNNEVEPQVVQEDVVIEKDVDVQQYTDGLNNSFDELQQEALQTEIRTKKMQIATLDKLINGEIDANGQKIDSYQTRKDQIKARITELEQIVSNSPQVDALSEYTKANEKLNSIVYRPGRYSNDSETKAMQLYSSATAIPDVNNIVKALDAASLLPIGSEVREPLIDAIAKLNNRYSERRDSDDLQVLTDKFNQLGVSLEINNVNQQEIEKLNNEYSLLEKEELEAKEKYTPKKEAIEKEIEELSNRLNNVVNTNSELTITNNEDEKQLPAVSEKQMPAVIEQEPELDIDDIPEVSEGFGPQVIKNIKKASNKLLEKVYSTKFGQKIKAGIDWMKKYKKAIAAVVATGLVIAGTAMLANELDKAHVENNTNQETAMDDEKENSEELAINNTNNEEVNVQSNIESPELVEKSDEQIFQEELQQTLSDIVDGNVKVYSSAENAANDINSMSTNQSQRENSWANATPNTFYDSEAQVLTREQAEQVIANGGEVVARFDNNGTHIGYVPISTVENTSEITK